MSDRPSTLNMTHDISTQLSGNTTQEHARQHPLMSHQQPRFFKNTDSNTWLLLVSIMGILNLVSNGFLAWNTALTPDEAHYALYGLKLDWSYFDHPPMVGWLQALALLLSEHLIGEHLIGEQEFILRLWPMLLTSACCIWIACWTYRTFGTQAVLWFVGLWLLAPMLKLLGIAFVPEVPLLVFSWATFIQTHKLALENDSRLSQWFLLGVALGLAALSKYTAVTLSLSVALALIYYRGWKILFSQGLWLAVVIAMLLLTPIILWNLEHEWISFRYQINQGTGRSHWQLMDALNMQLLQIAAYSPLIYILGITALLATLKRGSAHQKLLVIFALPILVLFSIAAAKGRSLPHWTAVGVVFCLPLIASWLPVWQRHRHRHRQKYWQKALLGLLLATAILLQVVLFSILFRLPIPYTNYQHPLADVMGWKALALNMKALALDRSLTPVNKTVVYQTARHQALPNQTTSDKTTSDKITSDKTTFDQSANNRENPTASLPLFISNWSHASRIAWYAQPLPVFVLDQRVDQFDLWYKQPPMNTSGIALAYKDYSGWHREVLAFFQHCHKLNQFSASDRQIIVLEFEVYLCENYQPQS